MTQPSTSDRGNDEYLREIMGLLWPPPFELRTGSGRANPPDATIVDAYDVLPSLDRPRIVLPSHNRRAAVAAVRSEGGDRSAKTRLRDLALTAAAGSGITRAIGTRATLTAAAGATAPSIRTYLSDALDQPVDIAFKVGPPRANRKPVIQVFDRCGGTIAFAKIGVSEFTNTLVAREAAALHHVNQLTPRTFAPPGILHAGVFDGLQVLVQSPLPIADATPAVDEAQRQAAMVELGEDGIRGGRVEPLLSSTYWTTLREHAATARHDAVATLPVSLERIAAQAADVHLPFGAWHGDWAPWNMAATPDRLLLWDWERYEVGVPLGFDALHHHFQRIKSTLPPDDAIRDIHDQSPRLLAPFGIAAERCSMIVVMYAATLATRYAVDFDDMGTNTWQFKGSPMLAPLTRFVDSWNAS